MNAKDLKNSILQLAIQGKLVEQRDEEGTARELIKEIEAEKKRLIKAGKIKKQKDLLLIKEEDIPFEIPKNWKWLRLGDVLDIARGGSPRPIKSFLTDSVDGINWIKIGDTDKGGKYINSTTEKIIKEGMKKSRFVRKGDFLLSNSMSFGRPYILNIDGCIHDGWLVLSQIVEVFYKDFLYYLLSASMVFNQFASIVSGAVVNNLNSDKVKVTLIPLPPLEEQKRIVAKIEELMPYVEKYDSAYCEVKYLNKKFPEDMQKSILQYALQGKLVEQHEEDGTAENLYKQIQEERKKLIKEGKIAKNKALPAITEDEIPFEIPESWKWVRLGDIGEIIGGGTPKTGNGEYWNGGNIPWLTPADMKHVEGKYVTRGERFITEKGLKSSSARLMTRGSIIYSSRAPIGYIAIAHNDLATNQGFKSLFPYVMAINEYIYYVLISRTNEIISRATGTTFKEISGSEFSLTVIPLPPLDEQKRIVSKVESLLPHAKKLENNIVK